MGLCVALLALLLHVGVASANSCDLAAINPACKDHGDFAKDAFGDNDDSTAAMCQQPCAQALLACMEGKDGAALKQGLCHASSNCKAWEAVRNLGDTCLMDDGTTPDGKPGDGVCNLESLKLYDGPMLGEDGEPKCKSNALLEMIDCVNNPEMADQKELIQDMDDLCGIEKSDVNCEAMLETVTKAMSPGTSGSVNTPGGVCCQGNVMCIWSGSDPFLRKSDFPSKCTLGCAKLWTPFWKGCGKELMTAVTDADEMRATSLWNGMCETTYHGGGN